MIHELAVKAFNKLSSSDKYKHVVLNIQTLSGNLIFKDASGIIDSNQKPMTLDTPFNIASVTKLLIASTILRLEEENKLSLTDLVSKYIMHPLIQSKVFNPDDQLSIYHLISHTSGIPDYLEIKDERKKNLFDDIVEKGDFTWKRSDFYDRVEKFGKPYFPLLRYDDNIKKARYSDTNFQLLIDIIETVTKKPIDIAFDDYIYKPLGLKHSFHEGTEKALKYKDKASIWAKDQEMHIPKALASFGDIYSTSDELIIFMRGLLSGKLFKKSDTLKKMASNWHRFGFQMIPTSPGWPIQYGLGMIRLEYPKYIPPFKKIPEFYGHTGVTGSWVFYVPDYELIVCGDVGQLYAPALPYQFMTKFLIELKKIK